MSENTTSRKVPFDVQGLHHFAWRCRDAEETRAFYEDLLGLPLVYVIYNPRVPSTGEETPHVHIFFQMRDGSYMAFFDLGDGQNAAPSPNTPDWVNHIALKVGTMTELHAAKARLEEAGFATVGTTDHGIIRSVYVFDPNGLRVEITTMTSEAETIPAEAKVAHRKLADWTTQKRDRGT